MQESMVAPYSLFLDNLKSKNGKKKNSTELNNRWHENQGRKNRNDSIHSLIQSNGKKRMKKKIMSNSYICEPNKGKKKKEDEFIRVADLFTNKGTGRTKTVSELVWTKGAILKTHTEKREKNFTREERFPVMSHIAPFNPWLLSLWDGHKVSVTIKEKNTQNTHMCCINMRYK